MSISCVLRLLSLALLANSVLGYSSTCEFIDPPNPPLANNLLGGATLDQANSNGLESTQELVNAFNAMTDNDVVTSFDMDFVTGGSGEPLFAFSPIASQTGTMRIDIFGGEVTGWDNKKFLAIFDDSGADHSENIDPTTCTGSGTVLSITVSDVSGSFKAFQFTNADELKGPTVAELKVYNMALGGVNGDPLIIGLSGQVFKFEGRSGAWYSALESNSLNWNMQFTEFNECPAKENMFVTAVAFTLIDAQLRTKHQIEVAVADVGKVFPGCTDRSATCLGNGSLRITIDGHTTVAPGDYSLPNGDGRVIAHNTFGACSRKWFDYDDSHKKETRASLVRGRRRLQQLSSPSPTEVLAKTKGIMLDTAACEPWIAKRIGNDDLFEQLGDWSTIHIMTPLVSFHIEYRQSNDKCGFHNIDAWISAVSPQLVKEEWHGIIGETRYPIVDANGRDVTSNRDKILRGSDTSYEVPGPFLPTVGSSSSS